MADILIDNRGIRRAVKKYDYTHAIAELIWNGFDAGAIIVNINFIANEIGNISEIVFSDNGEGIPLPRLEDKFTPFLRSDKEINPELARNSSKVHGINGVGRLTFFKVSQKAVWQTVYEELNTKYKYNITISEDRLNHYEPSEPQITTDAIGTRVILTGIQEITAHNFETDINDHLIKEFCWFLALHSFQGYDIRINGKSLYISSFIEKSNDLLYSDIESGQNFNIRFIQWKEKPRAEYSRYYYLDSYHEEKWKKTTTLNNKGDGFYHSLFIQSPYFDNVNYLETSDDDNDGQLKLQFSENSTKEVFTRLMSRVEEFLRDQRLPYIKKLSTELVQEYSEKGVFPTIGQDDWSKLRQDELKEFVQELYIVEPKMFIRLNHEQQKTLILLLNLVMDSSEREALFDILDEVVGLTSEERKQLSDVLKTTKLANITKTIMMIRDRLVAISDLKELIDKKFGTNEPKHIQKFIEAHYWLFGEQYHLVTAAEPDFEEALRRLVLVTTGVDEKQHLSHPEKNKEMDIYAVRKMRGNDDIENIVIELKRPTVLLGEKELSQVRGYLRVIRSDSRFNGANMKWTFFLIGNGFDTSGFIEEELESNKSHGERFLVHTSGNVKIYVMKWSEIITNFEIRYAHLLEDLDFERNELVRTYSNPDEIIEAISENSARSDFQLSPI